MKFSPKKAGLKSLTYFLACLLLYPLQAAPLPWYHTHFHTQAGANYVPNCSIIDFGQKLRYAARLAYYRMTHKKKELDQALLDIEAELKEFQAVLLEMEEDALLAIKQKYAINDEIWHKYCADIGKIKASYKIGMSQPHKHVTHDPAVPADIRHLLYMLLKENNINPESIEIVMADETKKDAQATTLATTTFFINFDASQHNLIMSREYTPVTITISPALKESPWETKVGVCAHEIQHVVCQHLVPVITITQYLEHYYSIQEADFKQSKEYQRLMQIYEAQAETLAALSNRSTAACMKTFRQESYYPDTLYEEHFYHLSTIDMLWKLHDKLEALYFS